MACSSRRNLSSLLPLLLSISISISIAACSASFHHSPLARRFACHGGPRPTIFKFPNFNQGVVGLPNGLSLLGHAHPLPADDGSLQISGSTTGGVFLTQPLSLRSRSPNHDDSMSFFTSFSFSMDSGNGDGLAFFISPSNPAQSYGRNGPSFGLPSSDDHLLSLPAHTLLIEFDTSMDAQFQDPSDHHVGLDIDSLVSLATANVSDGLSGKRLYAWIDYRATMKILEVRLSPSAERPETPIIAYNIDLSTVWQEEMYVGLSSSTGDAPQNHAIYSWTFVLVDTAMWNDKNGQGFRGPHDHDWHHGPHDHDWHHGPHDHDWHRGPHDHDWHHDGPRDWHHGPHDDPNWQPHDRPDEWHPDHHHDDRHHDHHHHDDSSDSWFGNMDDVWGIIFSLLFGAACGTVVAGVVFLVWSFVRRRLEEGLPEEQARILFGCPKWGADLHLDDGNVKTTSNGYEKLPTQDKAEESSC